MPMRKGVLEIVVAVAFYLGAGEMGAQVWVLDILGVAWSCATEDVLLKLGIVLTCG
jgi:hypothetical protein